MGAVEVLVYLRDRHNVVHAVGVNNVYEHADEHAKRCVFEIGELNVERPELDAPPDLRVNRGRRLKSHRVPVGRLEVLEVVGTFFVV